MFNSKADHFDTPTINWKDKCKMEYSNSATCFPTFICVFIAVKTALYLGLSLTDSLTQWLRLVAQLIFKLESKLSELWPF